MAELGHVNGFLDDVIRFWEKLQGTLSLLFHSKWTRWKSTSLESLIGFLALVASKLWPKTLINSFGKSCLTRGPHGTCGPSELFAIV